MLSPYNTATYMDSEFLTPSSPIGTPQATQIDNLFHAVSNILLQVNHTNQALLGYLSNSTPTQNRPDPKIRPKSFSGLPTEDILTWIDHFENVAAYHQWHDQRKALEASTLLDNIAATWFIQQPAENKQDWNL